MSRIGIAPRGLSGRRSLGLAVILNVLTTTSSVIDNLLPHKIVVFSLLGLLLLGAVFVFLALISKLYAELTELSEQADQLHVR